MAPDLDHPILAKITADKIAGEHPNKDWSKVKESVMLEGLRAKFCQHPDLRTKLLGSGQRLLVEHTNNDDTVPTKNRYNNNYNHK